MAFSEFQGGWGHCSDYYIPTHPVNKLISYSCCAGYLIVDVCRAVKAFSGYGDGLDTAVCSIQGFQILSASMGIELLITFSIDLEDIPPQTG